MMRLSKPTSEQYSSVRNIMPTTFSLEIPIVDLSKPEAKSLIVKACEEFGFFKVINHGVPVEAISQLESEAFKFFSQPITEKEKVGMYPKKITEKEKVGTANPLGYGNKRIGTNGDVGWVEYLLLTANEDHNFSVHGKNTEKLGCLLNEYTCATRRMACEILELMAEGLKIQPKNVLSKLVMDKQSDSLFRVNHYPACPEMNLNGENLIGFGEHTDPQIISLLRSNNTSGLQISLRDGSWISVPPDHSSFFINVGDSLQVMTNGRFRSVRHRVLANGLESRLSMIYFGGPPLSEKIAPLPSLMKGKESLYKEFTWFEYKNSSYATRLADNRLGLYERIVAS